MLKEIASILDISKHVTAEEIITLYREHPPRANAAKDGFIGDGDQDTDEYRDKAIYNHGATSTGPKAKHKFYLTDLHLGSELVKAIKDTVYELYSDEPGDDGRFTAILYRLLTECKGDIEATTEPLIGHLMPQVNAEGKLNTNLILLNEELPMATQMMDLMNRLILARKELKKINEAEHDKITEKMLIERVSTMIRKVKRYHTKDKLLKDFKESTTLKEAFKHLITFDTKLENQTKYEEKEDQTAFAVNPSDLRTKIGGGGKKKQAHFDRERIGPKEDVDVTHSKTPHKICLPLRDHYELDGRNMVLKPRATGKADYIQKCLNCLGKKHRVQECYSELGAHMKNIDGTAKNYKICWEFKRGECTRGTKCNFIHIEPSKTSSGTSSKSTAGTAKHLRDGQYLKVREKGKGKFQFQKVNHIGDTTMEEDDSESSDAYDEEPARKKPKTKRHKKKSNPWFNFNGSLGANIVMAVTLSMAVLGTNASGITNTLHTADKSNFNPKWVPEPMFEMNTQDAFNITVKNEVIPRLFRGTNQFVAIDDGGANLRGNGSTFDKRDLIDYRTANTKEFVSGVGGEQHEIKGYGTLRMDVKTKIGIKTIELKEIAYIPTFRSKIIAHNRIKEDGGGFSDFAGQECCVFGNGVRVDLHPHKGLVYWVGRINRGHHSRIEVANAPNNTVWTTHVIDNADTQTLMNLLEDTDVKTSYQKQTVVRTKLAKLGTYIAICPDRDNFLRLHALLGHPSHQKCVQWINDNYTKDQIQKKYGKIAAVFCETCSKHKVKAAVKTTTPVTKAKAFGEKIHCDVAGKYSTNARGTDYYYELGFVDSYSGHVRLYPMRDCSKIAQITNQHLQWVSNIRKKHKASTTPTQTNLIWQQGEWHVNSQCRLQGDSATYFRSREINTVANKFNFTLQQSGPYQQNQNGLVERMWQSIHTRSAAMRDSAGLNYNTWWWSDAHAAKTHNAMPSSVHGGKSPHEIVYGVKMNIDSFKMFGQNITVLRKKKVKEETKGRVGKWLGIDEQSKTNIIAFEKTPYDKSEPPMVRSNNVYSDKNVPLHQRLLDGLAPLEAPGYIPYDTQGEVDVSVYDVDKMTLWKPVELIEETAGSHHNNEFEKTTYDAEPNAKRKPSDGQSTSKKAKHQTQEDQVPIVQDMSEDLTSPDGNGVIDLDYWNAHLAVGKTYSSPAAAYKDKQFGQQYRDANEAEIDQLLAWGVITPVPISKALLNNEKIYRSMQTFIMKGDAEGNPERAKSRLLFNGKGMGDETLEGNGTYTFTPRQCSFRYMLANASAKGQKLFSCDLPNAFSQSLNPNVKFMHYPKGSNNKHPTTGETLVYEVRNLYGRRDSGWVFQQALVEWMKEIGSFQNSMDHALFRKEATETTKRIDICIWIDDMILSTSDQETADWFKTKVESRWATNGKSIKFEVTSFFLGANIQQNAHSIKLSQKAYIDTWVNEMKADGTINAPLPKPTTPLPTGYVVDKRTCPGNPQVRSKFRTLAAKIGWLALVSRPDVAYAANQLAQISLDPSEEHIKMAFRVIAYLANTSDIGIEYKRTKPGRNKTQTIRAAADASHWSCPVTRKSTSGYVCFLQEGPLNWHVRKQNIITLSSCESEIVAACEAVKDVLLIRRTIEEQRGTTEPSTELGQDNTSTISIIENPELVTSGTKSKHIAARFLWIKQSIDANEVHIVKVPTARLEADFFTKALAPPIFLKFREQMMSK